MYRILYVDDDPMLLEVGKHSIEDNRGFSVDCARSGREALKMIATGQYDAVVSDYQMPKMDGIALLKKVRAIDISLPFILFTGKGREEIAIEALNNGADFYLQKGGEPEAQFAELVNQIKKAVKANQIEKKLKESEQRYRNIVEDQTEFITRFTPDGTQNFVNGAYCRYFGIPRDSILGHRFRPKIHPEDRIRVHRFFQSLTPDHPVDTIEHRIVMPDGLIRWQRWSDHAVFDPSGTVTEYQSVGRDITERKQAESALARMNRALRMLSDSNQVLVHITDETTLMNEICRIAVESGGYRMAWIGFAEQDEAKTLRPVAHAGDEAGYLMSARVTWADSERGRGPGGTTIRTGQPSIVRNIPVDPAFTPWRAEALKRGYQSIIALPLTCEGRTFGAIGIYAGEPDAFDTEEVKILKELADDLAFGITTLRMRARRDLAEEALQKSEEKYHNLYLNSALGIFHSTFEGRFIDINPAMANLLGYYSPEEAVVSITSIPEQVYADPPRYNAVANAVRDAGGIVSTENRYRRRDGSLWYGKLYMRIVPDQQGKPSHYEGFVEDFTERKRAEEALRESESRLSLALDVGNAGIWEWNLERNDVCLNAQFHIMLGYTPGELPTTLPEWLTYHHPEDIPVWTAKAEAYLRGDTPIYESEHRIRTKAGNWAWAFTRGQVVSRTATGTPKMFMGIAMNVTKRREAEAAVAETEQRFRAVFDAARDGMLVADPETHRFVMANAAIRKQTGYTEAELLSFSISDIHPHKDLPYVIEQFGKLVRGEIEMSSDIPVLRRDGTVFFADINTSSVTLQGRQYLLGIFRDVTERKQMEKKLHENEERLIKAQAVGHTGSWEYNLQTGKIWGSAEGARIYGLKQGAGDFPIDEIEACIPERERVHQALVDLIHEGKEYNLEFAINPADGSEQKVIISVAGLEKDAQGNAIKVLGVIQDITERKKAQEEIAFKNIILSTQQETSLDGILIVDEQGEMISFNRRFVEMWGIPKDVVASRSDEHALQSVLGKLENPGEFIALVRYLYEHREEKSREDILLKDGRVFDRYSAPMMGKTGKYFGRVWYFRDITDRKRAEDALTESETRFRTMVEQSPVSIQIMSPDGRTLRVNKAFEDLWGLSLSDLNDYNILRDDELVQLGLMPYIQTGFSGKAVSVPAAQYDVRHLFGKGGKQWVDARIYPVKDAAGNILDVILMHEDISEYKRAEEEILNLNRDLERRVEERTNELRETTEYLNNLFNYANAPIIVWDTEFRITRFNHAFEYITGRTEKDVLGQPLDILFPADSRDASLTLIKKTLEGEHWKTV
ncbi:MAG: PAS domain S-box protein, partial [Methanoregula sp.]